MYIQKKHTKRKGEKKMASTEFLKGRFGIEVEMTGITRTKAANTIAAYLSGTVEKLNDRYDTHTITAQDGRVWKIVSDASIVTQKKANGDKVPADKTYSAELVSPILTYEEDIDTLQEIVRKLRKAGAFSEKQNCTGIHIHLDGAYHTPRSLRNFVNIIHSRNDLLYDSLQIEELRKRYCKKLDQDLVERMNKKKPTTFSQVEEIWYEGTGMVREQHYHDSRYHFINLHSFFHGIGTVELRGFNGTLHAGEIRAYIVLALAMNHQAITQKSASSKKPSKA